MVKLRWTNLKTSYVIDLITTKRKYSFEFYNKYSTVDLFNIILTKKNIKIEIDKNADWIFLKDLHYDITEFYPRSQSEYSRKLEIHEYLNYIGRNEK